MSAIGDPKGYVASAAITIFRAVELTASETVTQCGTLGNLCIGIAQEGVSDAADLGKRVIAVQTSGVAIAIAGSALSRNDRVRASALGKCVAMAGATAKQNQLGIVLTAAAADGDQIRILLTPGVQVDT